jgi:predicted phosphodiesterase
MSVKTKAPIPRDAQNRIQWAKIPGFVEWIQAEGANLTDAELVRAIGLKFGIIVRQNQLHSMRKTYEASISSEALLRAYAVRDKKSIATPSLLDAQRQRVIRALAAGSCSLLQLADLLDLSPKRIRSLVEELQREGHQIAMDHAEAKLNREPPGVAPRITHTFKGTVYRFGVISDTHICSKHADLEGLARAYEEFAKEGVTKVYHAGNIAEGQDCYPGQSALITHWGAHAQAEQVATLIPVIPGVTTYFIGSSSCHEGGYFKKTGLEFGRMPEIGARKDLIYLGLDEADVTLRGTKGEATMRLSHPGSGSAYALSYKPQKQIESYSGGEKPAILVIGHYHKQIELYVRNVIAICAGCLEFQTPFMRKRSLEAHRCFTICEAHIEADGSVSRWKREVFHLHNPAHFYALGAPSSADIAKAISAVER